MQRGKAVGRSPAGCTKPGPKPSPRPSPPLPADGSVSTVAVQGQDIVSAFGLDGYLAAAADDKGGRPAAARGGSTKKRR